MNISAQAAEPSATRTINRLRTAGNVVLKEESLRGTELMNVYSLGNRNISPTDFELTIWRGGKQAHQDEAGNPIPYIQIFGLDRDGDGRVDIDYDSDGDGAIRLAHHRL